MIILSYISDYLKSWNIYIALQSIRDWHVYVCRQKHMQTVVRSTEEKDDCSGNMNKLNEERSMQKTGENSVLDEWKTKFISKHVLSQNANFLIL